MGDEKTIVLRNVEYEEKKKKKSRVILGRLIGEMEF